MIDFFAPPRDDFLLGGKPAYISEGCQTGRSSQSGVVTNTSRCADPVARLEFRAEAPLPDVIGAASWEGECRWCSRFAPSRPSLAPASILLPKPSVMEARHSAVLRSDEI